MNFSERLSPGPGTDPLTEQAIGGTVRLLCQVRIAILAFALMLALLDGMGWLGVFLVVLAAPFSFVPALSWETRGRYYARNGIMLAGDIVVAVSVMLPLTGSPLMPVYAAATAALWGLFAGLRLALLMAAPLCLYQLTAYDDGWRGLVTGIAGAGLTVVMTWTGTHLGRSLRRQARTSADLASARADQAALAERLRLARDLHDTVAGDLAGLALTTRGLADRLGREGVARSTVALAHQLGDAVRSAHQHTRAALGELRDEPDGVAGPVTDLARRWTERTRTPAQVSIAPGVDDVVGAGRARHVRAIVTELLENVRKHAHASGVEISVTAADGRIELLVSDDGSGLPAAAPEAQGSRGAQPRGESPRAPGAGYGLRGLRERAALCGGHATWTRGPDGGTVVRVLLPVEPAAEPRGSTELAPNPAAQPPALRRAWTAEVA
ncbi:signal transduction histidine kinase [Promicromonospora sp. AC04]|uniref:sensor histidine kinase n=1 Tax=Promicromonospora sp. AC04 TaxID=2135723 RepID=UPI000D4FB4C4|nr:ATP-binding protein [Promicromonospora sp. AC04]PUB30156.1 signal transduction histidine kinase [Promicromonospora sp. AC04]